MSENIENNKTDNFEFNEAYDEKLLDHDYDGIKELDNPIPNWIAAIFYITIAISIVYGIYYFILDGPSQDEEYAIASAEHDKKYESVKANAVALELLSDEASLAEGAQIYVEMNCAVCHGAAGEGNAIGPNLTDNASINGCDFDAVFDVIKNGRATKGMTPFKAQLSDVKIQKVTSYVMQTLRGSSPENPKEAQGEACN